MSLGDLLNYDYGYGLDPYEGYAMGGVPDDFYSLGVDPVEYQYSPETEAMFSGSGLTLGGPELTNAQLMQETMPGGVQEGQTYDLGEGGSRFDMSGGEVRALGPATPGAEGFPGFNGNLSAGTKTSLAKFLDALKSGASLPRGTAADGGGGGLNLQMPQLTDPQAATIQRLGVPAPPAITAPTLAAPQAFSPMMMRDEGPGAGPPASALAALSRSEVLPETRRRMSQASLLQALAGGA